MSDQRDTQLPRRTFMKGVGAAVGAGLLGNGLTGSAAANSEIDDRLLNWRTVEAKKVWDRGYRGRRDRTTALTDSGIEVRHPDLGPWNGATVEIQQNELVLPTGQRTVEKLEGEGGSVTGTLATGGPGPTSQRNTHPFTSPAAASKVEATLDGSPEGPGGNPPDNELFLEKKTGEGEWTRIASSTTFGSNESVEAFIEGDHEYRFVVETYINAAYNYDVNYEFFDVEAPSVSGEAAREAIFEGDADAGTTGVRGELDTDTPKVVGWFDPTSRYGRWDVPRDPNGHGTHVSGIMAGTGAGSVLDRSNVETHTPRAVLAPGDFLEYEVEAEEGTNVYACAFGDNITVHIVAPDGREIHTSHLRHDKTLVDEPTVDELHGADGRATYTVQVRPWEMGSATENEAPAEPQQGTPTAGRLNEITVGTYRDGDATIGAREPTDEAVVHPGLAPNQSLVGIQGLTSGELARHGDEFTRMFNLRAVNMSWGPIGGAPLGTAGAFYVGDIADIADAGILTVAAAGNSITPANQGGPGLADEAISVVATGPLDGIASYSSGGLGAVDEDGDGPYTKPDVTAPGGDIEHDQLVSKAEIVAQTGLATAGAPVTNVPYSNPLPSPSEWIRAPLAGDADAPESEQDIRDYVDYPGTSMASPYTCGVASLVAEAMDPEYGDAPESIELPMPEDTASEDVMRLKQVLLATASETAFTAAPYHNSKTTPHQPTYDFGGRDPYEGYGRVNPDAAVDAVTRPFVADAGAVPGSPTVDTAAVDPDSTTTTTIEESLGLDVPVDSRAVAGYASFDGGTVEVSVDFSHYGGGNKGMTKGDPHFDLFVYDAESPAANGEPNVVASAQGLDGSPSVSVDDGGTYFVVAKLVNVPGVVNGYDVQAHFDLSVTYSAPALPTLSASGTRSDDGTAFNAGSTNRVTVEPTGISKQVPGGTTVTVRDDVPAEWSVDTEHGDVVRMEDETTVVLAPGGEGTVTASDVRDGLSLTYYVEAPGQTGQYTFGPASLTIPEAVDGLRGTSATFGGTDDNVVVGVDQNSPTESATTDATARGGDAGSTADGATDAVSGTTDAVDDSL